MDFKSSRPHPPRPRPWRATSQPPKVGTEIIAMVALSAALTVLGVWFLGPSAGAPTASTANLPSIPAEGSWRQYVRAPASRTILPKDVLPLYTKGNVSNAAGLVNGTSPTVLARLSAEDAIPEIVVDFGMNTVGILSIEFAGATNLSEGLPGIRLAFSETLQYLSNGDRITNGSDQIAVRPAPYSWQDLHGCEHDNKVCADGLHGFRYVRISLDALPEDAPFTSALGTVRIKSVSLALSAFHGTPDTFTGWFECSDADLTQWWYDAVYTNDLCTDTFRANDTEPRNAASPSLVGKLVLHDAPKRDRDPYVGDLAVSALTSYLSHDVPEAARNVLADLAEHQTANGWIPPASINNYTLPLLDYPLWWVSCSYDYLMYTGDRAYVRTYYPNLVLVLDTFYPSITNPATGLIEKGRGDTGGWGDYAFIPRQGPVTYYNALYVLALQRAASMATELDKPADARRWRARAAAVSASVAELNFDDAAGAFFDGTCGSSFCAAHAQDGNSLAILAGIANRTRAEGILAYYAAAASLPYGNAFYDTDAVAPGFSRRVYAFTSYFELAARFDTGLAASALEEIRRLYGHMSRADPGVTFWEGVGDGGAPYEAGYTSSAHGWATGVVPLLTHRVLGVAAASPGFATWTVRPPRGAGLAWARGAVPTPRGNITVQWQRLGDKGDFRLVVAAPADTRGRVYVPVEHPSATVYLGGRVIYDGSSATAANVEDGYVVVDVAGAAAITVGAAGPQL